MNTILYLVQLAVTILGIVVFYKIYIKIGIPGWHCLVPLYAFYSLLCNGLKRPILEFILLFVPFVNVYIMFMNVRRITRGFGKESSLYALGALFFPFIFLAPFAFGEEKFLLKEGN